MTKHVGKAGTRDHNRLPQNGVRRNGSYGRAGGGDRTEPRKLSCVEVRPLLRKFFVGQLATDDPELWRSVDHHVDTCQDCYLKLTRLEIVVDSNLIADAMDAYGEHAPVVTAERG